MYAKGTKDAAIKLHAYLLHNVLRLPMTFFYITPSGRILSRFSNDINTIDIRLPMNCRNVFPHTFRVCFKYIYIL